MGRITEGKKCLMIDTVVVDPKDLKFKHKSVVILVTSISVLTRQPSTKVGDYWIQVARPNLTAL